MISVMTAESAELPSRLNYILNFIQIENDFKIL